MLGILLMFVLLMAVVLSLPYWWHARRWGYVPSAVAGVLLMVTVSMVFNNAL